MSSFVTDFLICYKNKQLKSNQGMCMNKLIIVMMALLTAACANNSNEKLSASNIGYECEKYYPIGSSIPKKLCTTKAQRDELEKESKKGARNLRRATKSCSVTGC